MASRFTGDAATMTLVTGSGFSLRRQTPRLYLTRRSLEDLRMFSLDDSWRMIYPVFSIWKAFEGNTRDLGSFGEETDKTTGLHQHLSRLCSQRLETASQITRDAVTTLTKTASQESTTASECTTKPII
ncbi:hypothetical protein Tco_0799225 [Tanacetum coccineum]